MFAGRGPRIANYAQPQQKTWLVVATTALYFSLMHRRLVECRVFSRPLGQIQGINCLQIGRFGENSFPFKATMTQRRYLKYELGLV